MPGVQLLPRVYIPESSMTASPLAHNASWLVQTPITEVKAPISVRATSHSIPDSYSTMKFGRSFVAPNARHEEST
jgi:hypothetical protein